MTHLLARVEAVLERADRGESATAIARQENLPRETVRDCIAGRVPVVTPAWTPDSLEDSVPYAYLLGLYLGDGYIAAHRRGVYRLRIVLDAEYAGIIAAAAVAIEIVSPTHRVHLVRRSDNCTEVASYSKQWPALFPQHGPGPKHSRPIELVAWQRTVATDHPFALLRGLIHSDGCRSMNSDGKGWTAARYSFSNRSQDIHGIFREACDLVGVRWTTTRYTTYVSRKADVALLDEHIGPKR